MWQNERVMEITEGKTRRDWDELQILWGKKGWEVASRALWLWDKWWRSSGSWQGDRGMSRAQGIFRTEKVWQRFVAAESLLFPCTFQPNQSSHCLFYCPTWWGAFYCLCSRPFSLKLTFFLSLFIVPCQSLPGFAKRAGISGSLVLAVGKVIKGGMKRGERPVQRWRQHFSDLLERYLLLLESCMMWGMSGREAEQVCLTYTQSLSSEMVVEYCVHRCQSGVQGVALPFTSSLA